MVLHAMGRQYERPTSAAHVPTDNLSVNEEPGRRGQRPRHSKGGGHSLANLRGVNDTRAIGWDMARTGTLLGAPVGLGIAVYYGLWGPTPEDESRWFDVLSNVGLYVVFLAGFAVIYRPRFMRLIEAGLPAAGGQ